jgi:2-keto-3-deoxy-6-phosphogluconate aldolase
MNAAGLLAGQCVVPVVVIDRAGDAVPLARTLLAAGLTAIEVTLRTEAGLAAIECIAKDVPGMLVGAGSVRRATQIKDVKSAGAMFAVSPGSSDALLDAVADVELPFVPGAVTASEMLKLLDRRGRAGQCAGIPGASQRHQHRRLLDCSTGDAAQPGFRCDSRTRQRCREPQSHFRKRK